MDIENEISAKWSNMVNRILSVVEMALPEESKQYKSVKKNLNTHIYNARNNVINTYESVLPQIDLYVYDELNTMYMNIYSILLITFEDKERRDAIANAIKVIVADINLDIIDIIKER